MLFCVFTEFHPAILSWAITPVESVKQGEIIPDFSIKSKPGVKTKVCLVTDPGKAIQIL